MPTPAAAAASLSLGWCRRMALARTSHSEAIAFPRRDSEPAAEGNIEARIRRVGTEILERSRAALPSVLHGDWWLQRVLQWAMRDAALKTQLFRFVDVLPSLHSGAEVAEHLQEYLGG